MTDIVDLYTKNHLTIREIGKVMGVSHTTVSNWLRKAGIKSSDGEFVLFKCAWCGKENRAWRSRKHSKYCNLDCYGASKEKIKYSIDKLRRAKIEVRKHIDLQDGWFVNEDMMVFESEEDFKKYKRGGKVNIIFQKNP